MATAYPIQWRRIRLKFAAVGTQRGDVDTRLKKAIATGANVMRPPLKVPGVGRIAIVREPGGAMIGWITPAMS